MSNRFIFSYWEPLPDMDMVGERLLISLWRDAWSKAGLTPVILNESYAARHPIYHEFDLAVSKLPSINPPAYDRACFIRWLAVQVAAKDFHPKDPFILMADYDVFCYGKVTGRTPLFLPKVVTAMHSFHGNCPALVYGKTDRFAEVCHEFLTYNPGDKKHVSDQYVFEEFITREPSKFKVSMDVVLYGEKGWETAPAVHFSNSVMGQKYLPKHQWIPKLRPV